MATGQPPGEVHEVFKHYRTSASIFSATVIGVSSAILGIIGPRIITTPLAADYRLTLYLLGFVPLMLSIVSGVLVQYFIFRGYHKWANKLVDQAAQDPNSDFTCADKFTKWTLRLFLFGFLVVFIYLSIQYFQA